jgi:hypothetical protein
LVGGVPVEVPKEAQGFRIIERRAGERQAYWYAPDSAIKKAYPLKTIRLHGDLNAIADIETMFALCDTYNREMKEWVSRGGQRAPLKYWGTVKSLIELWQTDPESTFHENRHSTQQLYIDQAKPLVAVAGDRLISALKGTDLRGYFRELWAPVGPGKPRRERRAFAAMDMLRDAVKYGCEASLPDCLTFAPILQGMKFRVDRSETVTAMPKKKKVPMGFEFAEAIVKKGLEVGTTRGRAVALGVAAQFEFTLRQIDVIGYWLNTDRVVIEPNMIVRGKKAWRPGVCFEDFASGVLDLSTTKNSTDMVFDVSAYPLFQMALAAVPEQERRGPLVALEPGEPIRKRFYADIYREIADAAGVPATVWNARARHGGISEGQSSGADIVDVSKHAQHTDVATTTRVYVVPNVETSRRVAKARVANRKKATE